MPDYVEHSAGATEIGKLSAEAVVREHEIAAKEIEVMGAELIDLVKQCELVTRNALTVNEEPKETAGRYREEAKRVFRQIENLFTGDGRSPQHLHRVAGKDRRPKRRRENGADVVGRGFRLQIQKRVVRTLPKIIENFSEGLASLRDARKLSGLNRFAAPHHMKLYPGGYRTRW